MSNTAT